MTRAHWCKNQGSMRDHSWICSTLTPWRKALAMAKMR